MENKIKNKKGMIGVLANPKILLAVLLVGVIFYFGVLGSASISIIHNGKVLDHDKGNFNFKGIGGSYETVKLGCLRSQGGKDTYLINGDNDGEIMLCNTINDGDKLVLKSTLDLSDSGNSGENFIKAKIKLPKGKIKISYNYKVKSHNPSSSFVSFTTGDISKSFYGSVRDVQETDRGSYEFNIESEKEIEFLVKTNTIGRVDSLMGEMIIEFYPDEKITNTPSNSVDPVTSKALQSQPNMFQRFFNFFFGWFTK